MTEAQATEPRIGAVPGARARLRAFAGVLRRHLVLVVVLAAATALRVIALVAVYPGIWFSDSNSYLQVATTGKQALPGETGITR